jgi:hypothetical protein
MSQRAGDRGRAGLICRTRQVTPMMVAVSPFDPEVKGAIVDTAKV